MVEPLDFSDYIDPETKKRNEYFEVLDERLQEVLQGIDAMIAIMLQQGIITEVQSKQIHRHFEAYLVGWEIIQWILHEKPQKDKNMDQSDRAYLTSWLLKQPKFFDDVLKGSWPEWLPKPASFSILE